MSSCRVWKNVNILDLDAGNTRLKWRFLQDGRPGSSGALANDPVAHQVEALARALGPVRIDACRLSSVRTEAVVRLLTETITQRLGIRPQQPRPCRRLGGLIVEDVAPARLGCDRWLAMLGAVQLYPQQALLVVDAGTAMTLDSINSQGQFAGGLICPGLRMLRHCVEQSLDRITLSTAPDGSQRQFAKQSTAAAENGILTMALATIEGTLSRLEPGAVLVLCGGDAPLLKPHLDSPVRLHSDLVFRGFDVAQPVHATEYAP